MDLNRKKELFPYFAYSYSRENDPAKYGNAVEFDEWYGIIKDDEPMLDKITQEAGGLEDSAWELLEEKYAATDDSVSEEPQIAKCGAKIKTLKHKRGNKMKKCSCGCDLVMAKEKGGKLKSTCSCGCGGKMKK